VDAEPSLSRLACVAEAETGKRLVRVDAVCLDEYARGRQGPHLIKIDTEGAEGLVLRGMCELLARPADEAPVLVFEYSPANYRAFGYDAREILELLQVAGYKVYLPTESDLVPLRSTVVTSRPAENNLWAAKDGTRLTGLLTAECLASGGHS